MKVAIVNYGMGNLASVRRAFEDIGADAFIADRPAAMSDANRLVLPGVGAFGDGMQSLREAGWVDGLRDAVLEQKKPLLGICLGMQMLASRSYEGGVSEGLGLIPGEVRRLDSLGCGLRIPHVGWNEVRFKTGNDLLNGIPDASDFYFVHSYGFVLDDPDHLVATAPYGCDLTAIVKCGSVFGCQFHPEKSSKAGRQLLKNFMSHVTC
jgi:imidazole glycerol-phosphate synthase subunit HisH